MATWRCCTAAVLHPNQAVLLSSAGKGQRPELKVPRKGDGDIGHIPACRQLLLLDLLCPCRVLSELQNAIHDLRSQLPTPRIQAAGVKCYHSLTFPLAAVRESQTGSGWLWRQRAWRARNTSGSLSAASWAGTAWLARFKFRRATHGVWISASNEITCRCHVGPSARQGSLCRTSMIWLFRRHRLYASQGPIVRRTAIGRALRTEWRHDYEDNHWCVVYRLFERNCRRSQCRTIA